MPWSPAPCPIQSLCWNPKLRSLRQRCRTRRLRLESVHTREKRGTHQAVRAEMGSHFQHLLFYIFHLSAEMEKIVRASSRLGFFTVGGSLFIFFKSQKQNSRQKKSFTNKNRVVKRLSESTGVLASLSWNVGLVLIHLKLFTCFVFDLINKMWFLIGGRLATVNVIGQVLLCRPRDGHTPFMPHLIGTETTMRYPFVRTMQMDRPILSPFK